MTLTKAAERTELAVWKSYASVEKATAIARRCRSRQNLVGLHTQEVLGVYNRDVVFKFVKGNTLYQYGWDACERYLNAYVANIDYTSNDATNALEAFYAERTLPEMVNRIRGKWLPNLNWHGDMTHGNIIVDPHGHFTDIDLRRNNFGDAYFDLGKFYLSFRFNTVTDRWIKSRNHDMGRWCRKHGFDFMLVKHCAGIAIYRMGLLHKRNEFIEEGLMLCRCRQ